MGGRGPSALCNGEKICHYDKCQSQVVWRQVRKCYLDVLCSVSDHSVPTLLPKTPPSRETAKLQFEPTHFLVMEHEAQTKGLSIYTDNV